MKLPGIRLTNVLRFHLPPAISYRRADAVAVLALFALTLLAASWDLFREETILGMDAATQYYPWYYFLGESLRSGSIPAWNPYQFSGTPFAADPLSGWTYLPAMLLFTLLPLVAAIKSFTFLHLLLAGISTYALARVLGIGVPGAFLAAVAYEYNGYLYLDNTCCFQYTGVMVWLPLTLLGAELAISSQRWVGRGLWWGVSGLAISQTLASWFGQGSYYVLLALGGYAAYRTLLSPPNNVRGIRSRVGGLVLHGTGVLVFGFALAAAGLLPRLEYNALSNLEGGYPSEVLSDQSWWSIGDWVLLLEPGPWYAGVTMLTLALVAPLIARRRFVAPYFFALSLCALILSGQGPTPLHTVLYLLPYFERLHPHRPDRAVLVFYMGVALLAGAALTVLRERARRKPLLLALPLLAALFLAAASTLSPPMSEGQEPLYSLLLKGDAPVPPGPILFLVSALVLIAAYILLPVRLRVLGGTMFALLALVVFADLFVADRAAIAGQDVAWWGWTIKQREVDPAAYYSPSGAAKFLQSKSEEPYRYFGYDPGFWTWWHMSSPGRFADSEAHALEANGRPMLSGLQSIQGYNPTHIARYDQYMKELNGDEQNYHFMDVFEGGLNSPLLDLLNARYIIVPAHPSQENPASVQRFEQFERTHPTVYEDEQTKVLENPKALPRAWIVHEARQEESSEEALKLLGSGEVDPKETALLEETPPEVSQPDDPSIEQAAVEEYEANRIKLKTDTGAAGLLVLSEVYYPAWKAYVDGEPVPVHVADQLLRSVEVPAGEHEVELRYESWTLPVGIAISLVAYVVLIVLAVAATIAARHSTNGRVGKAFLKDDKHGPTREEGAGR